MKAKLKNRLDKLSKLYPDIWFKDGGEFASSHANSIWTGEGSAIEGDYAFGLYYYPETFGIHPKLADDLNKMGLFAEFYDGGTVFIYEQWKG